MKLRITLKAKIHFLYINLTPFGGAAKFFVNNGEPPPNLFETLFI